MTRGKKVCKILKEIRQQIADKNEIEYVTTECSVEEECIGTCPKCESEVRYLENELHRRRQLGKAVAVAGISLGIAGTFSTCNIPQQQTQSQQIDASIVGEVEPDMLGDPYPIDTLKDIEGKIDIGGINDETDTITYNGERIFKFCEIMPEFPGDKQALTKFLLDNIVYPKPARELGIDGTVTVSFIVDKNGKIGDIKIVRSPHNLLSAEAMRVVKLMPKWIPGKQHGKAVNVYYTLPITFQLD